MKFVRLAVVLIGTAFLSLSACGGDDEDNRLFGSAGDVYDLGFDNVHAFRQDAYFAVEYLKGSRKTVKLTVDLTGFASLGGKSVDLTEKVNGVPRGTLQRVDTTTTDFEMQVGTIEFDQDPVVGGELKGRFRTTLVVPEGRTLNGDFKTTVGAQ